MATVLFLKKNKKFIILNDVQNAHVCEDCGY